MRKEKIRVPRDIKELTDKRVYKKVIRCALFAARQTRPEKDNAIAAGIRFR